MIAKTPEVVEQELFTLIEDGQFFVVSKDDTQRYWVVDGAYFDPEDADNKVRRLKDSRWYEMADNPVIRVVKASFVKLMSANYREDLG